MGFMQRRAHAPESTRSSHSYEKGDRGGTSRVGSDVASLAPPTSLPVFGEGEGLARLRPPSDAPSSHVQRSAAGLPPRGAGGDEGPPIQCAGGMASPSSSVIGGVKGLFSSGMSGGSLPFQAQIQKSFGPYDISGVKSSSGPLAQRANHMMGSEAMTRGEQVAFKGPTSLHVAAHEAAHVLQHRTGLRIPGGVGTPGDRHERFADSVASGVTAGRSVAGLLDRTVGTKARTAKRPRSDAPVQMFTKIGGKEAAEVKDRISKRGGAGVSVGVKDDFYTGTKGTGLVATGVASMARDTAFETAALRFEQGLGTLAYNHPKTQSICDNAGAKVLAYFNAKYAKSKAKVQEIDDGLSAMGISDPGWGGAVGKSARAVREVLERGSVNERASHVEAFVRDILATDIMENEVDWRGFAKSSGYNEELLEEGYKKVAFTGDRYLIYDTDESSATGMQWHTRANVDDVRKKTKKDDPFHPSSVKAPKKIDLEPVDGPKKKREIKGGDQAVTTRDIDRIEKTGPSGMGVKLGAGEKAFQKAKSGDDKTLAWVEGARVYALNELDGWVYAQRQLSLPLVAGTSSTSARIMQSFRFLGAGSADDARLVAIGTMLVGRHHSLVEVMEAGKRYGASPYREGPQMYHDIAPLTDKEIREAGLEYPDEYVDPYGVRGGYSVAPEVEQVDEPIDEPVEKGGGGMMALLGGGGGKSKFRGVKSTTDPVEEEIAALRPKVGSKTFVRTRASIKTDLDISNTFTKRNSAQARMLRAVDAYHAAQGTEDKLAQLAKVRDEAAHWLVKHPKWLLGKSAARRKKFMLLRDEAAAVIQAHISEDEADYLDKLRKDELFAPSEHAGQGMDVLRSARGDTYETEAGRLVKKHGLSLAELAAIKVYCGPAYKFINPALEGDVGSINRRLLGFVREIKLANNNSKSAATRIKEAEEARQKLVRVRDPIASAVAEGELHAVHAMRGLSKLPPFTGKVYAGGALTTEEALGRFKTGEVQVRKSFASTSAQEFTASSFAMDKGDKLAEAYESIPKGERDPKKAPFPFLLRYSSKTGRDIKELSVDPGEKEVLFAPGTKLKIVRGADSPLAEKREAGGDLLWTYIDAEEVT